MAVRRALEDAVVPPIPACRVARIVNEREPLLFWVRTGRAQVEVAGTLRTLSAGEAIWIPAGIPHRIATETGTVAFPLFPGQADLPAALNAVVVLTIPPGWEDWLVFRFAHGLGYLRGSVPAGPGLLGLVAGSRTDPSLSVPGTAPPPLPRSAAALEVARTLLRTPGDPTDLTAFAIRLRTGERTIQRQFREETGMPFTRWRAAARVAAAATYLDAGRGVGWAGKHVGFLTAAGFTRAFREHTGRTPIDYARSRLGLPARAEHTLTDELVRLSPLAPLAPGTSIAAAPPIPASSTWARVNDFHVVVWVYRGTARVTIGERTWRLRRGDAMWLPAGVHNSIEIDAGALLLPLGARPGTSPVSAPPTRVVHFPLNAEDWLLHTVVANYSLLRPDGHDEQTVVHRVRDASQASATRAIRAAGADPVHRIIAAVGDDPAAAPSLSEWAEKLGMEPSVLHEQFVRTTGQTYPLWRAGVRMTIARQLLDEGITPGDVARRLGYAHASGFSQVFAKAHGASPRAFQLRRMRAGARR